MRTNFAALMMALVLGAAGAQAAERAVTLSVENMFCAACPFIVKQTLAAVPGVRDVQVFYDSKTAVVIFDDQETKLKALTDATLSIGYPSKVVSR